MRPLFLIVAIGACGTVPQSDACADFVGCQRDRDVELGITTNMVRYELDGACWENKEIGALCTRSCTAGLAWMRRAYADLPASCAP